MSAKKYLTTAMIVLILSSFSSLSAQDNTVSDSELTSSVEESSQFLIRTERNGKTKYVPCALPNMYFHQATASTGSDDTATKDHSEFTAKGGSNTSEEYYGYIFFLVQDGVIKASNESGDFNGEPGGLYTLSRFSYPLSIAPLNFKGKNINTIENHPLFEKDNSMSNMTIRLLSPVKAEPTLSTEPIDPSVENIMGQLQTDLSVNN
jgi:hypothetical protein